MATEPTTVAEFEAAQAAEYGKYRAAKPIIIDGALAFNTGDPVPVSHVTRKVVAAADVTTTEKG